MIETTKGLMDESLLEKSEGVYEDDNERTSWVEYRHAGELVHRSAHVHLKHGMLMQGVAGEING